MSILSTIKNNAEWKALALENTTESRAELLAALNEQVVEQSHSADVGFRGITNTYGAEFAATILGKLDAASGTNPLLKATYNAITTTGIDFSNPVTQGQLTLLQQAGVFTQDEADKLKAIGIWQVSTAKSVTGSDATEQNVIDWCLEIVRESWQIRLANAYNTATATIEGYTAEQLQALSWIEIHDLFESEPE